MKNKNIIILICIIVIIIIAINFNVEKTETKKDVIVYDEVMSQQFINLGFTNEQAQKSVNIIKKIGINSISSIENYDTNTIGYYDESYPNKGEFDIVYEFKGNDNTQYECDFLVFIKNNEIIHICYYGFGDKIIYYTKDKGILHKPVHQYVNN